jgi:hypothetical protein
MGELSVLCTHAAFCVPVNFGVRDFFHRKSQLITEPFLVLALLIRAASISLGGFFTNPQALLVLLVYKDMK